MKILAVGMNYAAHNKELHHTGVNANPVIFSKGENALLREGKPFFIPDFAERFDYEGEIVVKIHRTGKDISERFAHRYYNELTIGIDFTARDLQQKLRAEGLPWEICKSFDGAAVTGKFLDKSIFADGVQNIDFELHQNGKIIQKGNTRDMIFSIDRIVSYCSRFFTLKTGDLIFTGTPVGVGPVAEGDLLEGYIANEKLLEVKVK